MGSIDMPLKAFVMEVAILHKRNERFVDEVLTLLAQPGGALTLGVAPAVSNFSELAGVEITEVVRMRLAEWRNLCN